MQNSSLHFVSPCHCSHEALAISVESFVFPHVDGGFEKRLIAASRPEATKHATFQLQQFNLTIVGGQQASFAKTPPRERLQHAAGNHPAERIYYINSFMHCSSLKKFCQFRHCNPNSRQWRHFHAWLNGMIAHWLVFFAFQIRGISLFCTVLSTDIKVTI